MTVMPERARAVVLRVAAEHRVAPADMLGPRRFKPLVRARWQAWSELRELSSVNSLTRIGGWFGRDHSTVLDGLRRHAQLQARS